MRVITALRKKLGLPQDGFSGDRFERLEKYSTWIRSKKEVIRHAEGELGHITKIEEKQKMVLRRAQEDVLLPINSLALSLKLDPHTFETLVLYNDMPLSYPDDDIVRVVSYGGNPIQEPGVYIQVTPMTQKKDVIKSWQYALVHYKKFFHLKGRKKQKGVSLVEHDDLKHYLVVEQCLTEWLKIQNELRNNLKDKKKHEIAKEDRQDLDRDVYGAVGLAVSRLGLTDTKESRNEVRNDYYKVIDRYQLPRYSWLPHYLRFLGL